jgi:hypothetical protein
MTTVSSTTPSSTRERISLTKSIRTAEQLIDQFLTGRKEESENAFQTLVTASNEQLARLLQFPIGTGKGRRSRARDLLRAWLCRRGWDADELRSQCD